MPDSPHPNRIEFRVLPALVVATEFATGVRLAEPLRLEPILSEKPPAIRICDESLDIDVFAATCAELNVELRSQLDMLWTEYALENDDALSLPAQTLKRRLLALVKS